MGTENEPFAIAEALSSGWKTTRENAKPLLLLSLSSAAVALLHQALARPHGYGDPVLLLMLQAGQLALAMLMAQAALRLHDGEPFELAKLGPMLKGYLTFFVSTLLCEMVVAFGLLLFIVPGVLWATRYCFAPLLVLDRKLDPFAAMSESVRLTEGARGPLFGFGCALLGINLLGLLCFGVGVVVTVPVSFVAAVHVMRRLQARAGELAAPDFTPVVSQ